MALTTSSTTAASAYFTVNLVKNLAQNGILKPEDIASILEATRLQINTDLSTLAAKEEILARLGEIEALIS